MVDAKVQLHLAVVPLGGGEVENHLAVGHYGDGLPTELPAAVHLELAVVDLEDQRLVQPLVRRSQRHRARRGGHYAGQLGGGAGGQYLAGQLREAVQIEIASTDQLLQVDDHQV